MTINSFYNHTYSIDPKVISKICDQVLFRIAGKIRELTIEQDSIRRIVGCCTYPELDLLTLINCEEERLYQDLKGIIFEFFTLRSLIIFFFFKKDDQNLRNILEKQVINLHIDIKMETIQYSTIASEIFALILSLCKNLTGLNFFNMFGRKRCRTSLFLHLPPTAYISSSLLKLQIYVETFVDCLYVLDGRFDSLSTLIIDVGQIFDPVIDIGLSVSRRF
jgi:hypothetical protein